jgi:hypothetical protein
MGKATNNEAKQRAIANVASVITSTIERVYDGMAEGNMTMEDVAGELTILAKGDAKIFKEHCPFAWGKLKDMKMLAYELEKEKQEFMEKLSVLTDEISGIYANYHTDDELTNEDLE